jgi:hypothetical protein
MTVEHDVVNQQRTESLHPAKREHRFLGLGWRKQPTDVVGRRGGDVCSRGPSGGGAGMDRDLRSGGGHDWNRGATTWSGVVGSMFG